MALMRFTTCCLIVFLLTAWLSNANVHRASDVEALSTRQELAAVVDGKHAANVAVDQTQGGRKMGIVKPEELKVGAANIGRSLISSGSKYDGICGSEAKKVMKMDAECKKKNNFRKFSEEVDGKQFVAFNADYRAPRHHPPKNN